MFKHLQMRNNNIIIYNIPESNKTNLESRQKDDEDVCKEIIEKSLEIDSTTINIQKIVRLGKEAREGRNRPTLLVLDNENQKINILKNARKQRTETDTRKKLVGIAPDLTPKQRQQDYYLRQEIRDRKTQGETSLYIKNGRLC